MTKDKKFLSTFDDTTHVYAACFEMTVVNNRNQKHKQDENRY